MYLHVTLTPKPGGMSDLMHVITRAKDSVEGSGMALRGAYHTTSGVPGRVIDLWELHDANAVVTTLEGAAQHPKHQGTIDRLGRSLWREQLRLIVPTGYSPEQWRTPGGADAHYLQAVITPHYGQVYRACDVIAELRSVLEERLDWRLLGGYRTVVGDFGEIINLWELPGDRTVDDMLAQARTLPAFVESEQRLAELVRAEELLTLRAAPYA